MGLAPEVRAANLPANPRPSTARAGREEHGALGRLSEWTTVGILRTAIRPVLPLALAVFTAAAPAQERDGGTGIQSEFRGSLTAMPEPASLTVRGTVYVPAYSDIRIMGGRTRMDLAATLSIHNTSSDKP